MVTETGAVNKTGSVGSFLRKSRESQGISLDEAARVTRISSMYLSALEEERFEILPNPAYAKGFLRAYAGFLGLSGDEIVAVFERRDTPASPEPSGQEESAPSRNEELARLHRRRRLAVIVVLLAVVLAAAYLFREGETTPEHPSTVAVAPQPSVPVATQQPRSSAVVPAVAPAPAAEKPANETMPSGDGPPPSGLVLKLKITQDSSLNVTIDGMISQQYDLKAGDLIEWKADRAIVLDLGNAAGVEAELNGRPLKRFGEEGKSAHVVLTAGAPPP
jgi:cytoskeleton protein RodZ